MEVVVGTWNIFVFGDRDYEGISELIRDEEFEIIGIQEAAVYHDGEKLNMPELIAEELDWNYEFYVATDFRETGGERKDELGNAVFSKYRIFESEFHNLNPADFEFEETPETEPRILVDTVIDLGGKKIRFLTTHLQYSHRFETTEIRKHEIRQIINVVRQSDLPVVLTGDFNVENESEEIQMLEEELGRIGGEDPTWTTEPFSYRGWEVEDLEYRVDNIFVSDEIKCIECEVVETEISDHLPIKARLEV